MEQGQATVRAHEPPANEQAAAALDRVRRGLGRAVPSGPADEPGGGDDPMTGDGTGEPAASPPRPTAGWPEWFVMPSGGPPAVTPGTPVAYVRMHARLTANPAGGERQCMLATLRVREQDQATARVKNGDALMTLRELTKQCIKVVDGHAPDWQRPMKGPYGIDFFWEEIGSGYRQRLQEWYARHHSLSAEDKADFFANCIDDRVAG